VTRNGQGGGGEGGRRIFLSNSVSSLQYVFCIKKSGPNSQYEKNFATRTPVSTKKTNWVAPKKHTSGSENKSLFGSHIFGSKGVTYWKSDQNLKKNSLVLAGLR